MASIDDVGQSLARVLAGMPPDQLGTAEQELEEIATLLGEALAGATVSEAAEIVEHVQAAREEVLAVFEACHRIHQALLEYLAGIGWMRYGDNPPALPHPSTTPRVPTDAAGDRSWVEKIRERLPRYEGGQTTGLIYDQDGHEIRLSSGREEESERVRLSLHNSEVFPPTDDRGAPGVVIHVETKYAQRMKETGQTRGVVVLNNRMCTGDFNCEAAVRAILPRGSVLVVWQPGRDEPIEIRGEARP